MATSKVCSKCGLTKPSSEFWKNTASSGGKQTWCRLCQSEAHKDWARRHPTRHIFLKKRAEAKRNGIEFDLEFDDIQWPDVCPVLGIRLNYDRYVAEKKSGPLPDSPSFDRVDPTKGYVKGNVIVVSLQANRIKSNATIDELCKVASFYSKGSCFFQA